MSEARKEQEEGTTSSAAGSQGSTSGQATETVTTAAQATGDVVPRAQFEKLQADLENFKRIEEERKGKEKKRQEALLAEQGKYKDLYDTAVKEIETMKAQLEKLQLAAKTMLEEEMKELPEDFDKTLIPNVDDYDKAIWLRKAKALIVKKPEPKKGDGTPPAGGDITAGLRSIYTHPMSPKR